MVIPRRLKQLEQPREQAGGQGHTSDERSLLGRLLRVIEPEEVDRELVVAANHLDVVRPHAAELLAVDSDVGFFRRLFHGDIVAALRPER
jgi:hypothetical protein